MADNYTPIPEFSAATTAVLNAPLEELDDALGNLAGLNTDMKSSLVAAVNEVDAHADTNAAAIVVAAAAAAVTTAEVLAARDAYASLDARLDTMALVGSSTATLTNGVANAGQKVVVVDSTTGFLAGAPVVYTLVGGVIETNTVSVVNSTVQLTMTTNLGTGGIDDDTYLAVLSLGALVSSGAVPGASSQAQQFSGGTIIGTTSAGATIVFPPRTSGRGQQIISSFDNGPFLGTPDPTIIFGYNLTATANAHVGAGEPSAFFSIEGDYNDGSGENKMEMYAQWAGLPSQTTTYRPWFSQANKVTGAFTTQFSGDLIQFLNAAQTVNIADFYPTQAIFYKNTWVQGGENVGLRLADDVATPTKILTLVSKWGLTATPGIFTETNSALHIGAAGASAIFINTDGNVGIGNSFGWARLHVVDDDAVTDTVTAIAILAHNTSGTAAAGFGAGLNFMLEPAAGGSEVAATIVSLWNDAATPKADLVLSPYDTAAREGLRLRATGSAAAIGFLGATPAVRIAHVADPTGGGTADAEARAAINSILATLETFGFHATS